MRYYRIELTKKGGSQPEVWTSLDSSGNFNPNAQNIILDLTVFGVVGPLGGSHIQIWGIPIQTVSQGADYAGGSVKVYAGMSKGLPLADPSQAGLILDALVYQAFGNWVGLDLTLDLFVAPQGGATQTDPAPIVHNQQQGQMLGDAMTNALQIAYPDFGVNLNVKDGLSLPPQAMGSEVGFFHTLEEYAQYCNDVSKSIFPEGYGGVNITFLDKKFYIYDGQGTNPSPSGTTKDNPKQLVFKDMIGQPTWIGPGQINVNLVMRADLKVGDFVKFPPSLATQTEAENTQQAKDKSIFSGSFVVTQIRHVGDFRQPEAMSWVTSLNMNTADIPNLSSNLQGNEDTGAGG